MRAEPFLVIMASIVEFVRNHTISYFGGHLAIIYGTGKYDSTHVVLLKIVAN